MKKSYIFLVLIIFLGVYCYIAPLQFRGGFLDPNVGLLNWGLITLIFFALTILAFLFEFETAATGAKQIILVSMLGTMSALSRLPFAALMNFQPCTFFIICSGYVFGPVAGFMVATLTTLISNLFVGHGPWTVYQIFTWGLVGVSASYLRRIPVRSDRGRVFRTAFVAPAGHMLLIADYDQIELRCIAHLAQDPGLIQAFEAGDDIHTATAAKVFHIRPEDVHVEERSKAKMVLSGKDSLSQRRARGASGPPQNSSSSEGSAIKAKCFPPQALFPSMSIASTKTNPCGSTLPIIWELPS